MRKASIPKLYLATRGLDALANSIMFTTYSLYYIQMLHLNPLELMLVGTAVEVTVALCEVPTGVVADSYSRRLSVLIGTFGMAAAYLLEGSVPFLGGLVPFFWGVVLAEIVRGVGWTFTSGARSAWIVDEIGREQMGPLFMRAGKIGRIMSLVGIPVSALLFDWSMNLPFLAGGIIYLLLGVLQMAMPETGFKPKPREGRNPFQHLASTFTEGVRAVRGNPILIALLAVTIVGGAAGEGFSRLREAHMVTAFSLGTATALTAAQAWSLIAAAGSLLGILMAHFSEKRLDLANPRRLTVTLLTTSGLKTLLLLTFALSPNLIWAIASLLALRTLGAIQEPVAETWTNQQIPSTVRATVLSMISQMDAVGQTGGGAVIGLVGNRYGVRTSLTLSALLLSPALAVYGWAARRTKPQSTPQP